MLIYPHICGRQDLHRIAQTGGAGMDPQRFRLCVFKPFRLNMQIEYLSYYASANKHFQKEIVQKKEKKKHVEAIENVTKNYSLVQPFYSGRKKLDNESNGEENDGKGWQKQSKP